MIAAGTYVKSTLNNSGVDDASTKSSFGRRSLLSHIFRPESSSNPTVGIVSGVNNSDSRKDAAREPGITNLAQCRPFTPLEEWRITSLVIYHIKIF